MKPSEKTSNRISTALGIAFLVLCALYFIIGAMMDRGTGVPEDAPPDLPQGVTR